MTKTKEYGTLDPVFPKKAYLLFLFILHDEDIAGILPLEGIFTKLEDASIAIENTVQQLNNVPHPLTVPHETILFDLSFQSLVPLKKAYWDNPSLPYDTQTRLKTFSPLINNPFLYSLLVTPFAYDDNTDIWYLNAALPLLKVDKSIIERFMLSSDQVVEPRAKHAAIYTITDKKRFNWSTKEITAFDTKPSKLVQTHN